MTQPNGIHLPTNIKTAFYKVLLKRIPPEKSSLHLEDLVNALMDNLSRGELQLHLEKDSPPEDLQGDGWPEAHRAALFESGWIDGDQSPMVLTEHQLSWRRWHDEIHSVVQELFERGECQRTENDKITSIDLISSSKQTINAEQEK